jgi:uncharacterized protein YoxC
VIDPLFWLGLSILLVAVSLTAVLVAALPALHELSRAARSAEKLFDTLSRELPPTLEAIRLTGVEISNLTDDVSESVQSAGRVVQQLDQGLSGVKHQAKQAQVTTRSVVAGFKAAWKTLSRSTHHASNHGSNHGASHRSREPKHASSRDGSHNDLGDRLPADTRPPLEPVSDEYVLYSDPYRYGSYGNDSYLDGSAEITDVSEGSEEREARLRRQPEEF